MTKLKVNLHQICYLGLGSNQGDSAKLLSAAIYALTELDGLQLLATSGVYLTEPQGDPDQPWFFNQVAKFGCALSALELLAALQDIENRLGRVRGERRFGPRSMDIDILLFGGAVINEPDLTVPHPRLRHRAFALLPLAEIEPGLSLPDGTKIKDLLTDLRFTLTGDKIYQTL